jgi:hypothetical protein
MRSFDEEVHSKTKLELAKQGHQHAVTVATALHQAQMLERQQQAQGVSHRTWKTILLRLMKCLAARNNNTCAHHWGEEGSNNWINPEQTVARLAQLIADTELAIVAEHKDAIAARVALSAATVALKRSAAASARVAASVATHAANNFHGGMEHLMQEFIELTKKRLSLVVGRFKQHRWASRVRRAVSVVKAAIDRAVSTAHAAALSAGLVAMSSTVLIAQRAVICAAAHARLSSITAAAFAASAFATWLAMRQVQTARRLCQSIVVSAQWNSPLNSALAVMAFMKHRHKRTRHATAQAARIAQQVGSRYVSIEWSLS